jgi:hypothetical protein
MKIGYEKITESRLVRIRYRIGFNKETSLMDFRQMLKEVPLGAKITEVSEQDELSRDTATWVIEFQSEEPFQ